MHRNENESDRHPRIRSARVLRYEDIPDPVPRAGRNPHQSACGNRQSRARRQPARRPRAVSRTRCCRSFPASIAPASSMRSARRSSRWRAGDRVAAAGIMPLEICAEDGSGYNGPQGMMGIKRPGGFAELVAVPACAGVAIPQHLDFHRAAVVHAPRADGVESAHARRRAEIRRDRADHGRRRQSRHDRHPDRQERDRRARDRRGRLRRARVSSARSSAPITRINYNDAQHLTTR